MSATHEQRIERAMLSLNGLSVGDAFGECFFSVSLDRVALEARLGNRLEPQWVWKYTDDSEMAMGIMEVLELHHRIDPDALAEVFARRYAADDRRGYGGGAHQLLTRLGAGASWEVAARELFDGAGSMGNGGAMRVAPLGAYFADDSVEMIVKQATLSAQVTHAHPEGQAGAVAVALAAAFAWKHRGDFSPKNKRDFLEYVIEGTPRGAVRNGVERAMGVARTSSMDDAAAALGNGSRVTAPDTVPFTLWCAARHLDDYKHALWTTVSAGGDMDTNCAIVGGIVALSDPKGIPPKWLEARESMKW
jgi:ADP-ribosylglycohydrolase